MRRNFSAYSLLSYVCSFAHETRTHSKKMHGKSRIPSLGVADRLVCLAMKVMRRLRLRTLTWRLYQLHWRAAKSLLMQTLGEQLAKYSGVRTQTSPPPVKYLTYGFKGSAMSRRLCGYALTGQGGLACVRSCSTMPTLRPSE